MKGLRGWALYGVLIAIAAAVALATRTSGLKPDLPSIDNPGPTGTRALYLYLEERGHSVSAARASLRDLPRGTRTVVVPAPTAREIDTNEVEALKRFVEEDGGTLVYLAPRPIGKAQARLEVWLGVEGGPPLRVKEDPALGEARDPAGATAKVQLPYGAAAGLARLRVAADDGLGRMTDWAPVAGADGAVAVAWRRLGKGDAWVLAGPDLAENKRLELLDNLRFWEQLASAGPMLFDEFHHQAAPPPPVSRGIVAFALQLLACAAVFAWARGSRFGPPRPEPVERHRSSLEYLHSLAWLTRRARVEPELLRELSTRLRVLLHERLGIAPELPESEVALAMERHGVLPAQKYLEAVGALRHALSAPKLMPREYLRVSRELARIERQVNGRSADPGANP